MTLSISLSQQPPLLWTKTETAVLVSEMMMLVLMLMLLLWLVPAVAMPKAYPRRLRRIRPSAFHVRVEGRGMGFVFECCGSKQLFP